MPIESVMPSNRLILCRPLLPPPSIFPSSRVFSNKSAFPIRWPKHWSFGFSISLSDEYSELISFSLQSKVFSSWNWTWVSSTAGRFFTVWATREAQASYGFTFYVEAYDSEFIFVEGWGLHLNSLFACGCPAILASFAGKTFLCSSCLCSFIKGQLPAFMGVYFWAVYSVPLVYDSVIMLLTSQCFNYCSCAVCLEIRTVRPSILFFFPDCFDNAKLLGAYEF